MKAFEIQNFGIDNLALVDREQPRPGPAGVLVRLKAASLNYRDYMMVQGSYNPKLKRPLVPLSDGVGIVEEIGADVTRFKKGDRVAAHLFQNWIEGPPTKAHHKAALGGSVDGTAREFAVFPEEGLVAVPSFLSDVEAATLPCAAVTAWHALFEHAANAPGDMVLLQGTGGVSIFALQLAVAGGLRVIITSSSEEKLVRAKAMGAHELINYKTNPKWDVEARNLTGGLGVDHVVEVGGGNTLGQSIRAIRTHGVISVIGALTGAAPDPAFSPVSILIDSVRIQGIYVGSRVMFERMNRAIELHRIKPVVDQVFPWTDLKAALRHMETQRHFGKICLTF
jgi:NADPH:quinone reductase-like Zn-dependent oxidoreductase